MNLSEQYKSSVKSAAKQLLDVNKAKASEMDCDKLRNCVQQALNFLGLSADEDDLKDLVHDLEYEVSIRHTTGSVIYNDYENDR